MAGNMGFPLLVVDMQQCVAVGRQLLAQTIQIAVDFKLIKAQELTRIIVDTTVQPKAIAHATESALNNCVFSRR